MPTPDASLTLRRTIRAPRDRVFRLWTQPSELTRWFTPPGHALANAVIDLRVGGKYRLGMRKLPDGESFYVSGEYREVNPPARIAFTWTWEEHTNVRDSLVTIDLAEVADGTELRLTHELLPNQKEVESHTAGWSEVLDSLVRQFE